MMKLAYRGFDLEAKRERSLGGNVLVYYSAYRQSDSWCLIEDFNDGDTVGDTIACLREDVDSYHHNPADWE